MALPAFRILIAVLSTFGAVEASSSRSIDQARIHSEYNDGEFEKVVRGLEGFLKSGRTCSRSDSLFAAKHLAVVYAANPATRELGRYHMFRLLEMAPGSDLLDMFVGDEVDAVFDKVRRESGFRRDGAAISRTSATASVKKVSTAPALVSPMSETGVPGPESIDGGEPANGPAWRDPGIWIGGGAALAVVAFTFFYAGSDPDPARKTYVVPAAAASR